MGKKILHKALPLYKSVVTIIYRAKNIQYIKAIRRPRVFQITVSQNYQVKYVNIWIKNNDRYQICFAHIFSFHASHLDS